jgi:hypothetical protein
MIAVDGFSRLYKRRGKEMEDKKTYFVGKEGSRNNEDRLEILVNSLGSEEMDPVMFSGDRPVCPPPDPAKPGVQVLRAGTCMPYRRID